MGILTVYFTIPSREVISKDEIRNYFIYVADTYGIDTEDKLNSYIQSYL